MPTVATLHVYPVKGLRGRALVATEVEPWGLAGDRRFLVVDGQNKFMTQRDVPALATVGAVLSGAVLTLEADGHPPLRCTEGRSGQPVAVTVWRDCVPARTVDPAADAWLERVLGRPCRLVHMDDPAQARPVDPTLGRAEDRVSFADGFPVLLTSSGSLADLNGRLANPVGMERFRPNLVITEAPAWAEDGWQRLRIGETMFDVVSPCTRCIVTTTDQRTGARAADVEPIRTLQRFRRSADGQVLFGVNLVPRRCGPIAVGDTLEVVA